MVPDKRIPTSYVKTSMDELMLAETCFRDLCAGQHPTQDIGSVTWKVRLERSIKG
jgi:hypothetical protein